VRAGAAPLGFIADLFAKVVFEVGRFAPDSSPEINARLGNP
jgi:hypothetical protein